LFNHFSLRAFPSFSNFNTSSPSDPIKKRKQNPTKQKYLYQENKTKQNPNRQAKTHTQAKTTQPNPQRQVKVINQYFLLHSFSLYIITQSI
jgi:hypothetical protein